MRRKGYALTLAFLVVVGIGWFFGGGHGSLLWPIVFPDDTVYGPRFSETGFEKITVGMTTDRVTQLIGPPLKISKFSSRATAGRYWIEGDVRTAGSQPAHSSPVVAYAQWIYSQPGPSHENYHVRVVIVSDQGTVLRKGASFYSK